MIERIVRLKFKIDKRKEFLDLFENHLKSMENFKECQKLELLQDKHDPGLFFTHSQWSSLEGLEKYRSSQYFRDIWGSIKPWFEEKPHAWSLEKIEFN